MRRNLVFASIILFGILAFAGFSFELGDGGTIGRQSSVAQVLEYFGEEPAAHAMENSDAEMVRQGKELVLDGVTTDRRGKKTKRQSKHFKCTSCHNMVKDDPDLSKVDPQARLNYCIENELPYLQATSLYGAVNRTTFYNDDYQKKYAWNPRIGKAHTDLKEAIQLCAVECAQGRPLKNWELESVLAYLWSLDLKLDDLNISDEEIGQLRAYANEGKNKEAVEMLNGKFLKAAPAHFTDAPKDAKKGYDKQGNAANGQHIYQLSCLHCHDGKKYSMFELDDHKLSHSFLESHFDSYGRYSIYQVSRYGAPSYPGKRAYMPQYPVEKLTNQQMEDLRAYIEKMAK